MSSTNGTKPPPHLVPQTVGMVWQPGVARTVSARSWYVSTGYDDRTDPVTVVTTRSVVRLQVNPARGRVVAVDMTPATLLLLAAWPAQAARLSAQAALHGSVRQLEQRIADLEAQLAKALRG